MDQMTSFRLGARSRRLRVARSAPCSPPPAYWSLNRSRSSLIVASRPAPVDTALVQNAMGGRPRVQPPLQDRHGRGLVDHRALLAPLHPALAEHPAGRDRGEPFVGEPD